MSDTYLQFCARVIRVFADCQRHMDSVYLSQGAAIVATGGLGPLSSFGLAEQDSLDDQKLHHAPLRAA